MEKKLYRSRTDKTFAGVCGGLGKYINVDPTLVRVIYVLASLVFAGFPGLIVYIVLACIIPEEPMDVDGQQPHQTWQPYQAWSPQDDPPEPPQAEDIPNS